jgi:hypothetical protein
MIRTGEIIVTLEFVISVLHFKQLVQILMSRQDEFFLGLHDMQLELLFYIYVLVLHDTYLR